MFSIQSVMLLIWQKLHTLIVESLRNSYLLDVSIRHGDDASLLEMWPVDEHRLPQHVCGNVVTNLKRHRGKGFNEGSVEGFIDCVALRCRERERDRSLLT